MESTTTSAAPSRYTFDNAVPHAREQLRLLSEILDAHSVDVLTRIGVGAGWSCLDLGAGAGTIATFLRDQVGPAGQVVAIDKDPRHITDERVSVQQADVRTADLGTERFDLVHVRLLLMHLPDREEIVERIARSLRTGGIVVVSDWDCRHLDELLVTGSTALADAFLRVQQAMIALGVANGVSVDWARRAPHVLATAGLTEVRAEVHNSLWHGGEPGCLLVDSNSRQLESPLRASGITDEQFDVLRRGMHDPTTMAWSYTMVTTTARRPA
jgi:SAM-dependent methyltransferase